MALTNIQRFLVGVPTLAGICFMLLDFWTKNPESGLHFPSPVSNIGLFFLAVGALFAVAVLYQSWYEKKIRQMPSGVV